ncbi:hypothetical protein [Nonomuraea sp. NPDC049725]|uniref:LGFP repeat-containing protein n=1 Tax=Nonomuraea sp. NPDC049725 TaxID=3154508 RepID=UPI003415EA7A
MTGLRIPDVRRSAVVCSVVAALLPAAPSAHGDMAACDPALVAGAGSLVGDYWRSKGEETSVYGCPVTQETGFPDKRGSVQRFRNGQIAWSPNMGEQNLLRVYRKSGKINLRWGPTSRDWDFFHVRWNIDAQPDPARDVQRRVARETPWTGSYAFNPHPGVSHQGDKYEVYNFSFQGCDRGTFGSTCGPWSNVNIHILWRS